MSDPEITQEDWEQLNGKYKVYSEMVKPSLKFTPDTILMVAGNLTGIMMILNFERLDIIRSKAIGFILKGRA